MNGLPSNPFVLVLIDRPIDILGGVEHTACALLDTLSQAQVRVVVLCPRGPDMKLVRKYFGTEFNYDALYSLPRHVWSNPFTRTVSSLLLLPRAFVISRHATVTIEIDSFFPTIVRPTQRVRTYVLSVPKPPYFPARRRLAKALGWIRWTFWKPRGTSYIAHSAMSASAIEAAGAKTHRIVYPRVADKWFEPSSGRKNQVLLIARFVKEKEIETSIDAFANLENRFSSWLVLAGATAANNEYFGYLQQFAARMGVRDRVVFKNNPTNSELLALVAESKGILSCQTHPESFEISILEGMAAGCVPIVPTKGGLYNELLLNGCGFQFSTTQELTKSLGQVLRLTQPEFEQLSARAKNRARHFDTNKFSQTLLAATIETPVP